MFRRVFSRWLEPNYYCVLWSCVVLPLTVQLTQPSVVAEFRWWDSISVVLYGAVATGVVEAQVDLGGLSVKRIFDEPTDHVVQRGDDDGRLDLGHDIRRQWLDGHGRLHISEVMLLAGVSGGMATTRRPVCDGFLR